MAIQFENFDKTDVYNNEINPLVEQIRDICGKHDIPALMAFTFQHDDKENTGSSALALVGNCRNNALDVTYVQFAEMLKDFPNIKAMRQFAMNILMADVMSDLGVNLNEILNKVDSDEKAGKNEAE